MSQKVTHPQNLLSNILPFCDKGLEIVWVKQNLKPYNKLIYALESYGDSIIVSADDDIFYPSFWLQRLYSAYVRAPQYIHAHRAHKVTFLHTGEIAAYENWEFCVENVPPSFRNFATGVGGVLYPPHSLHECVLDSSVFTRLAASADDVWFWACALLKGTKINVIDNNHSHLEIIEPSSQDSALWQVNWLENQNNIQIKNVLNHYPQLLALLAE